MHQHRSGSPELYSHLTGCFQEGLALDVAHRTTNFDYRDVSIACAELHSALDLVGDVRNHLDGAAQIVPATLFTQDLGIHFTRRKIVRFTHCRARKTLVVPQVQVRFGTVFRHENLTVLERAHRARIDVNIGVEFQKCHFKTTGLEDSRKRSRSNAFTQRRNHSTCDEYVSRHDSLFPNKKDRHDP